MFKAAPVAELLRSLIFSPLNHSSSHRCGFESRETSQVLHAGGQVFFFRGSFTHLMTDSAQNLDGP